MADINKLERLYEDTLSSELSDNENIDWVLQENIASFEQLRTIVDYAQSSGQTPNEGNDYSVEYEGKKYSIMWWWEMLVSRLYSIAMDESSWWIDTYAEKSESQVETLKQEISKKAMDALHTHSTVFVPWYSGNIANWLYRRVWRGYSDWTAAMMYSGIRKYYMGTDVAFMIRKLYGLSSADPRVVDDVQLFTHMSYELLLQMIDPNWADAGFVNRAAAMPEIFRNWWEMRVYNDSGSETKITMKGPGNPPEGIKFVQHRRTQQLRIHSYNMNKNWYFAYVTSYLAERWYSIIDDSSDATGINLMLVVGKRSKNQTEEEFRDRESIEYDSLCSELRVKLIEWEEDMDSEVQVSHESKMLIFTGGEHIDRPGILSEITRILANAHINLWPVVQTSKPKVIVFWVDESQWVDAVRLIHNQLIENPN